ncbi:MAG: hypothetical protein J3R72DRAFT_445393 [Linnemannia gamsii]|nr:MAG: hypothetical protein J3R72DRAFT_445393 [Linnemannia gamsii]
MFLFDLREVHLLLLLLLLLLPLPSFKYSPFQHFSFHCLPRLVYCFFCSSFVFSHLALFPRL